MLMNMKYSFFFCIKTIIDSEKAGIGEEEEEKHSAYCRNLYHLNKTKA